MDIVMPFFVLYAGKRLPEIMVPYDLISNLHGDITMESEPSSNHTPYFLHNTGEIGDLIMQFEWSKTKLGPMDTWPLSLRITLYNVLHSGFPMFLFWGEEFLCFYNEAFRPSLGVDGKHPAIGKKAISVWGEIWHFVGPLLQKVLVTGEHVTLEDQYIPFYRNGKVEDIYWTFSYSPALGEDDKIVGVLVTCVETTAHVLSKQSQTSQ